MKKLFLILPCLVALAAAAVIFSGHTLFRNGKSSYSIVVADDASESEKWAADELGLWLGKISGATIPVCGIDGGRRGHRIVLGHNSITASRLPDVAAQEASDESFTYCNRGGDIFIFGGSQRGTMYGVFSFLENEFGCRWYTSTESLIPQKDKWGFRNLYDHEEPGIMVRNTYYHDAFDPVWSARNKNNGNLTVGRKVHIETPGGGYAFWGCHTLGGFVPVGKYFKEHPEYFSEIDGKRISEYTQLCLSNPDVLRLVIEAVRAEIKSNPDALIYDISQNDHLNPCQCEKCRAIKARYGDTESGIMVWFVNQVADALKDEFPDKYFGTFAYQYTRTPPTDIVPRDNVVIRLCSIECCFLHDFAGCAENEAFLSDLRTWGSIAPHLYIWDYVTQFNQYLAPFPNFASFQPNIRMFRENNAIGIMEQGDYQSSGSAFGELKQYLLSKLLWNPDCDVQAVTDDFLNGYYGGAADEVREFYDLCNSLVTPDTHMGCFADCNHPLFNDEFINEGILIFHRAVAAAGDDSDILTRVERAFLPVFYLKGARNASDGREDLDFIKRVAEKCGISYFAEWNGYITPQEYYEYIENSSVE